MPNSGAYVTFAALGRGEIDAADHHRQCHGVDFDRQRRGVSAAWQLKTAAFQALRPNH